MWRHYLSTDDRDLPRAQLPGAGRRGALPARLRRRGRRRQAAHLAVQRARDAVGRRGPDHRPPGDEDAVPDRDRGRHAARPRRRARRPAAGGDPQDPRPPARDPQRPDRVRLLGGPAGPAAQRREPRPRADLPVEHGHRPDAGRVRDGQAPATPRAASSTPTTGAWTPSTPPGCTTARRSRRGCGPRRRSYQIMPNGLANLGPSGRRPTPTTSTPA